MSTRRASGGDSAAPMGLAAVPVRQREAAEFIWRLHRHHRPPRGDVFRVGALLAGELVGVVTVGRPVSRHQDDGWTVEVTRCCTDGTRNACSFLYARAWDGARALGFRRIITYTLPEEGGASLRAVGWRPVEDQGGGEWVHSGKRRANDHPTGLKVRWENRTADYTNAPRPALEPKQLEPHGGDLFGFMEAAA